MNLQPFTASIAHLPVQNGGVKEANLHFWDGHQRSPGHQTDVVKGSQ